MEHSEIARPDSALPCSIGAQRYLRNRYHVDRRRVADAGLGQCLIGRWSAVLDPSRGLSKRNNL